MSLNTSRRDERWVCRRRADFALRDWPDGSVLFDEANGQLQRLTPAAGGMMSLFLDTPEWTSCALAQRIFGETPAGEDIELVANALASFQSLNLIERLPD
jgi:hypothetical protein